jgi:predicted nucleic acid-binding Zn ribbon protein
MHCTCCGTIIAESNEEDICPECAEIFEKNAEEFIFGYEDDDE